LIEEYVKKYSCEEWVNQEGFVKKEEYYKFNDVIKKQLQGLNENIQELAVGEVCA